MFAESALRRDIDSDGVGRVDVSAQTHSSAIVSLAAIVDPKVITGSPTESASPMPADWTNVLEAINHAGTMAVDHRAQLREQAEAHRSEIDGLLDEISVLRQKLSASDELMERLQAQADACIAGVQAQSEQRLHDLQAQMTARVRKAEERSQAAQVRADAAETWLKRIEAAAQTLISGDNAPSS